MSKKLIRIDLEESKRKVAGLSGCRRCLFISEYQTQLEIEKRFADKKGGDRILSAMQEDGLQTDSADYSIDTLNRYQCRTTDGDP